MADHDVTFRILGAGAEPVGMGFLVTPRQGYTAVHTLADSGVRIRKGSEVVVDFPIVERNAVVATIESFWERSDIARLSFADAVTEHALTIPVDDSDGYVPRDVRLPGVQADRSKTLWARCSVSGWLTYPTLRQLDTSAGHPGPSRGFSGAPALDVATGIIAGLLLHVDSSRPIVTASMFTGKGLGLLQEPQRTPDTVAYRLHALVGLLLNGLVADAARLVDAGFTVEARAALETFTSELIAAAEEMDGGDLFDAAVAFQQAVVEMALVPGQDVIAAERRRQGLVLVRDARRRIASTAKPQESRLLVRADISPLWRALEAFGSMSRSAGPAFPKSARAWAAFVRRTGPSGGVKGAGQRRVSVGGA